MRVWLIFTCAHLDQYVRFVCSVINANFITLIILIDWLAGLGLECLNNDNCRWPSNAECDDGDGTKRCRCQRGFQQYDGQSNHTGTATNESLCGRLYALIILTIFSACSRYILHSQYKNIIFVLTIGDLERCWIWGTLAIVIYRLSGSTSSTFTEQNRSLMNTLAAYKLNRWICKQSDKSKKSWGATQNARPDIARLDNAAPDQTLVDNNVCALWNTIHEFCLWAVIVFFVTCAYYCIPS